MADNDKLPSGKRGFQGNLCKSGLILTHVIRDACNSKANAGKIQQKIIAVQFYLRQELQSLCGKSLVEIFTGGASGGEHQNRILQKFLQVCLAVDRESIVVYHKDILKFPYDF